MPQGWYKLDNVAKMFVATQTRRDPRVFRLGCTLYEEIDPQALDEALARTARQFPGFQVTLHQGLFWHYFQATDKQPRCEQAHRMPCAEIYGPTRKNGLLYQVSYYGCRIDLDMFHALADGTGGLEFLRVLLWHYLKLRHPEALAGTAPAYDASAAERTQDSYKKFYGNRPAAAEKDPVAYRIHTTRLPYDQTQFFEAHCSAAALRAQAQGCGVSVTSYLAALLIQAIHAEMPALERSRPIVISLPVNLRNYYPSATTRNFFNSVRVPCTLSGQEDTAAVAHAFEQRLRDRLSEETIKARMDGYEQLERLLAVKAVPLALKNPCVRLGNWWAKRRETATLSNLGRIQMQPELAPYIRYISGLCSTSALFVTVCSYGDELVLGVSSVFRSTNILKRLIRSLAAAGADMTLYATEVETE